MPNDGKIIHKTLVKLGQAIEDLDVTKVLGHASLQLLLPSLDPIASLLGNNKP
jgi:hypothetical protein